jgi:hypothetical protein
MTQMKDERDSNLMSIPEGGQWGERFSTAGMAVTEGVTPVLTEYVSFEHFCRARRGAPVGEVKRKEIRKSNLVVND